MKCPVCRTSQLWLSNIEPALAAQACETCGGCWISSTAYWRWLGSGARHQVSELSSDETTVKASENESAKICPECGHILLKYQVGHGEAFLLDHCGSCNGVGFDRDEWKALKTEGLNDNLHLVFTEPWQNEIRREAARQHFDAISRTIWRQ